MSHQVVALRVTDPLQPVTNQYSQGFGAANIGLPATEAEVQCALIEEMDAVRYASSLRASVNRKGSWPKFDYWHGLGFGTRREAVARAMKQVGELKVLVDGVAGILTGAFLMYVHTGIFARHTDEVVLGMFVVLAGFLGVVTGCVYWLKGKGWPEAIVCIAFMPLTIFLVPFVRLLVLNQPLLLLGGMVVMSLILVVVVFALPDRSGFSRHSRHRAGREAWKQFQSEGRSRETGREPPGRRWTKYGTELRNS